MLDIFEIQILMIGATVCICLFFSLVTGFIELDRHFFIIAGIVCAVYYLFVVMVGAAGGSTDMFAFWLLFVLFNVMYLMTHLAFLCAWLQLEDKDEVKKDDDSSVERNRDPVQGPD